MNLTPKELTPCKISHICCCDVKAEKQLGYKNIYQDVNFSDRILRDLVDKNKKMFRSLKSQGKITEKKIKYFRNIVHNTEIRISESY